jgi:hypothetical protein
MRWCFPKARGYLKAPGHIYADRNQLDATIKTSIAPIVAETRRTVIGLHAVRQRRLVE